MSQQFTVLSPSGGFGSFSATPGQQIVVPTSSSTDPNALRRNWYKNPSQMNVNTVTSFTMDSRNSIVNPNQVNATNGYTTVINGGGNGTNGSNGYTVISGGNGTDGSNSYTVVGGGGNSVSTINGINGMSVLNGGMNGMNGINGMNGMNGMNGINGYNNMSIGSSSANTLSKQSLYGGNISQQALITNKATGSIQQDKPVKVYDLKTNKPIDTVPNQLKLPVTEDEYESVEEKEQWAEQQRYLGFSKQKFNAILGVHIAFLILSVAALIVCVVLFVVDSATDYEWKLFGIISSGGLALCLFFGIVFLLLYAKWKYERCKEELEAEAENKDHGGNDIKKAGLTKIFKYSKPGAGGGKGGQLVDTNPVDYMATGSDPTPAPTLIHPSMLVPTRTITYHQQPQIQHVQHLQNMSNKTLVVKEPRRQIITVRRGSVPDNVEFDDEEFTDFDQKRKSTNSKILVVKPRKKSIILKNVLKKMKAPSRTINVIPVTDNMVSYGSSNIIVQEEPSHQNVTTIREVRSPSHIPVIEIEPEVVEAPRVIKISRNEMVASRTPVQSSSSRTQLINSSSDKKPVILTKNFGEDLNAFRE